MGILHVIWGDCDFVYEVFCVCLIWGTVSIYMYEPVMVSLSEQKHSTRWFLTAHFLHVLISTTFIYCIIWVSCAVTLCDKLGKIFFSSYSTLKSCFPVLHNMCGFPEACHNSLLCHSFPGKAKHRETERLRKKTRALWNLPPTFCHGVSQIKQTSVWANPKMGGDRPIQKLTQDWKICQSRKWQNRHMNLRGSQMVHWHFFQKISLFEVTVI